MPTYKTPGVYVEEISKSPPSVAEVETAIPAFIGYTEKAEKINPGDLHNVPTKVSSLLEFTLFFGEPPPVDIETIVLDNSNAVKSVKFTSQFYLYDSLRLFFDNGGGKCYIVSIGTYDGPGINKGDFLNGLDALKKQDEPTIIVLPDAVRLDSELYQVQIGALNQCNALQDRFAVMDLLESKSDDPSFDWEKGIDDFRTNTGTSYLKYGAAYTPWLKLAEEKTLKFRDISGKLEDDAQQPIDLTTLVPNDSQEIKDIITKLGNNTTPADELESLESSLREVFPLYRNILHSVNSELTLLPPSGAIAGVYARVDADRGVWKAPANMSLNSVKGLSYTIDNPEQEGLNVDVNAGKSINAIREFTGRGILVWGARTLAGNDNEWRYVSVRRFFNMVEESVKKSTSWAVFEPNDANTWIRVKAMIENYLIQKWREGALAGAKPDHAFYVKIGLGLTMTQQDILEGRMNVEIGMAVVRPAEFIILKFSHKMQES